MKHYYGPRYVEARLIDAARVWDAMGDREMNWLKHADASNMPAYLKEASAMDEKLSLMAEAGLGADPPLRRGDITRKRIDMAQECIDWLAHADQDLRDVMCYAVRSKMRGRKRVDWTAIRKHLRAFAVTADALRKRYYRGLNQIADELNTQTVGKKRNSA